MKEFHLEILTPERPFYRGNCLSLTIPTGDGSIGILAGHSPLTAAIPDGEISFVRPNGERVVCAVSRGMADVGKDGVRLLCGSALLPEEIDEEAERLALEEAELNIKKQQGHREYAMTKLAIANSMNKLRVKNRSTHNTT